MTHVAVLVAGGALAALALLLAGAVPAVFIGIAVAFLVGYSGAEPRWRRWEWTSDPVTIGLVILLIGGLLLFFFVSPSYLERIFRMGRERRGPTTG